MYFVNAIYGMAAMMMCYYIYNIINFYRRYPEDLYKHAKIVTGATFLAMVATVLGYFITNFLFNI